MQKNGFLMRFISCTLALVLLLGTIPMGALRVNAAEGEYAEGAWVTIPGGTQATCTLMTCEQLRATQNTAISEEKIIILYEDGQTNSDDLVALSISNNNVLAMQDVGVEEAEDRYVLTLTEADAKFTMWTATGLYNTENNNYIYAYFSSKVDNTTYYLCGATSDSDPLALMNYSKGIDLRWSSSEDTFVDLEKVSGNEGLYLYSVESIIQGTGGNAALYSRDYTLEAGDFNGISDYLPTILGENYIYLSANDQTYEEGTDEKLSLQEALTAGKISYSLALNGAEATTIDTVGTYTLAVTYSGSIELGNITVTVNSAPVSISVDPTSASLNVGETQQVTATVKNSDSTPVWSSSNPDVASVDENGLVTAVAAGNATITASVKDGENVLATATASVTVTEVPVPKLTASSNSVVIGQPVTLTVSIPDGTAIDHTIWNSSTSILNIYGQSVTQWETYQGTASATISPIVEGTTEITATVYGPGYHDQYATLHATITVTKPILTVEPATVVMKPYSNATVAVTISDDNGNTIPLTNYGSSLLSTDNNSVVNQTYLDANNGSITISNNQGTQGTANVTFYLKHGNTEITSVTVPVTVTDVTYTVDITDGDASASDFALEINGTKALGVDVKDASGNPVQEAKVTWSSSNSNVAKVDENGNVTAVAPGEATITATYDGINDSVKVTVNQPTIEFNFDGVKSATVNVGSTVSLVPKLSVTVGGEPIEAQPVIDWSSADEDFATVENGVVSGVAEGNVNVFAKLTAIVVNGVTVNMGDQYIPYVEVTVTDIPMVGFDLEEMPTEIKLDAKANETVEIPLKLLFSGVADSSEIEVGYTESWGSANLATAITATREGNMLTLNALKACEGTFTVTITSVLKPENSGIQIDPNRNEYTFTFAVEDNSSVENGTLTMAEDSMVVAINQTASLPSVSKLMHGTYEVPADKIESVDYSSTASGITVEGSQVTAGANESTGNKVTVTVTYLYGEQKKNATAEVTVNVVESVAERTVELGIGKEEVLYGDEKIGTYYIPVGATMPLVPHVDMLDEFGSYDIAWEVIGPDGVISVAETTYGGLRAVGEAGIAGVQSITNAVQQIKALKEGEVTLRACLTKVDGEDVQGIPDVVKIIVVPVSATEEVVSTDFYNRNNRLHIPAEDQDNPYEFRIIDQHTFLPDSYGMDARIIAQAGDTRVDFSQVKVAVYKNGQLLLDDQGNPFIIPTSELSFYDVSTEKVGWVKVRVTYKDYYKGTISLFEDGATGEVEAHLYDEYTTGEGNTDGYVWMYVCPKVTHSFTQDVEINGEKVTVTMKISDVRPWLGEAARMENENKANLPGFYRDREGTTDEKIEVGKGLDTRPLISISFRYKEKDYLYTNYANTPNQTAPTWQCPVTWSVQTTGAITGADSGSQSDYWTGKTDVASDGASAYSEVVFRLKSIALDGTPVNFDPVAEKSIPIIIRDNSVYEATAITFGYTPSWGGQSTAYKSFLGGIPISAYAISYVADLSTDHFQIGITDGVPTQMNGGSWFEWFSLDVPLGTTAVETTFHTVTRNDGVVFIFNPEEKAAEANYTISLDPQMLILSSKEKPVKDVPNTGTLVATVRDEYGNLIGENVPVKVKWTIRNAEIAATDVVRDASGKIVTTGKDQSTEENFTGPTRPDVGVTGGITGVTYLTVQLMEVNNKDVSKWGIADYSIIYVIEEDYKSQMDVVIDYDKPIDIDIHDFVDKETGYNFIGFSDLEHSLRQHAYTAYGEIEIVDGDQAYYTPGMFVENVDDVYVIFQHVDQDGKYWWHHYLINVIPATVMYYETDGTVADEFTCNGDWTNAGSDVSVSAEGGSYEDVQDDYDQDSPLHDEVYGYDSSYDSDNQLSNSASMFVQGMSTASGVVSGEPETSASFSFTGTGFDIIARTDMDQATLRVHVTKQGEDKPIKIVSVICKGENELYQIPVISVKGLDYDVYDVEIIVYASYTAPAGLEQLSRGNEFYFDAIRIYDPVKGNAIAEAAYKRDGEYAQTITQIGKLLIDQKEFKENTASGVESLTGAVFMDSYTLGVDDEQGITDPDGNDGFVTTTVVGTYDAVGPNNEVYLGQNQGIAFILRSTGAIPASIQVGAKSIMGDSVTLNAKIISKTDSNKVVAIEPKTINTSSAMYYVLASEAQIKELFGANEEVYVVIWNTQTSVLSVTDIKVSYGSEKIGQTEYLYSKELEAKAALAISGGTNRLMWKDDGWFYCDEDGNVVEAFSGLASTENTGTWYIANGKVDFSYNGLYQSGTDTYYIRGGCVDDTLNGIAERDGQWLYFTKGKVDSTFSGIAAYGNTGKWYVQNGEVMTTYSGLVEYEETQWYIVNGLWQSSYEGTYTDGDTIYTITNGKVTATNTNS